MKSRRTFRNQFKNFEIITYFKGYSLFFRFYLLILVIIIILIVSFTFYISSIIQSNTEKQYAQMNQQMLIRTVNQMDTSIYFLDQILSVAGNNRYVVDAAVRPGVNFGERNQNVAAFIKEIPKNNSFITQIWLFEGTGETVFSSDGMVSRISKYQYAASFSQVLAQLENKEKTVVIRNSDKSRSLLTVWGGDLFLAFESLKSKDGPFLLKIVAKINMDYLFKNTVEEIKSLEYGLVIKDKNSELLLSNPGNLNGLKECDAITYASGRTHWTYNMYAKKHGESSWLLIFGQILPFLLLATVGSLIFALIAAEKMYSPISNLTKLFLQANDGRRFCADGHKNGEIGFLYQTYSEMLKDKEKAEYLIRGVRPDLEGRLFLRLINGTEFSEMQLEQQLKDIYSVFRVKASYRVMMIYFHDLDEMENMASYLSLREIERGIGELLPAEHGHMLYIQKNDFSIIVVQHPLEYGVEKILEIGSDFEKQIRQMLTKQGVTASIACGEVYRNLKDIPRSYEEANDRLRRRIYFQYEGGAEAEEPVMYADDAEKTCLKHLQELTSMLDKNDVDGAEKWIRRILTELREQELNLDMQKQCTERLLDVLIERSLQFNMERCYSTEDYQEIYRVLHAATDKTVLTDFMEQTVTRLVDFIKTQSLRKQYRIVAKAKEYIDENYDNGDLSVQMISENIGISASYLSNLFTTQTDESLVGYINEHRVNVAIDLLQNTTISIKEVGYRTGFNTAQNFNRVFKRVTGKTPSKYREQKLE